MDKLHINPKDIIFSLDIGTRSIIATVGVVKDKKFNVIAERYLEHNERTMIDGQIHDINMVASEVKSLKKELEEDISVELNNVSIAAAGRFLRTTMVNVEMNLDKDKEIDKEVVRSLELTAVKEAEKQISDVTQGKLYCVGYSVKNYYLNGYVISNLLSHKGDNIAVEVIATFLPRSVIDSLYSVMGKVGLNVKSLTLEPIAAMEAVVPQSFRLLNIALVDIGAGTSDIAISSNETITAYGMVPLAGDEVTEIIAKTYLVDFNTAETIKKNCTIYEKVKYVDVLGLENEVPSEDIIKVINPVVDKITTEVATKITELNGGKSPGAVFLVGGGAYTPNFIEFICSKLKLGVQRVVIKGRKDVVDCICKDNDLKSIGVTVLGIALVSIKKSGHDFIDVILNDKVISLFNAYSHTVKDVMIEAGISPKILVGKNGKNIRFTLNGIRRVAFGELTKRAQIRINGEERNLDSKISEGDNIEMIFAKDGKNASPKVYEYVKNINSTSFYLNDIIHNIEPVVFINDNRVNVDEEINENEQVDISFPHTLGEYKKYFDNEEFSYFMGGEVIEDDYVIKEGDRIFRKVTEVIKMENLNKQDSDINVNEDIKINGNEDASLKDFEYEKIKYGENFTESAITLCENEYNIKEETEEKDYGIIDNKSFLEIVVNGERLKMFGKENYVFIDIFNFIDFDLSVSKGDLALFLNEKKAGYYDELSEGDVITIKWE